MTMTTIDDCLTGRDPATIKADVVGRSCYADRLLGAVRLPDLQVGDLFAFLDTGAYQEVSASNFNAMPRPAAVLVTGRYAAVIRRAETLEDVFARDVVPDHLHRAASPPLASAAYERHGLQEPAA